MGDSLKYWYDSNFGENEDKNGKVFSNDVLSIVDLFKLLSAEDKLKVKQLIREERIW